MTPPRASLRDRLLAAAEAPMRVALPKLESDLECVSELRALLREAADALPEGWQPIETAPTDGSTVLLAEDGYVTAGFYHDGSECYGHRGGAGFFDEADRTQLLTASNVHATHWRPMPAAPTPGDER